MNLYQVTAKTWKHSLHFEYSDETQLFIVVCACKLRYADLYHTFACRPALEHQQTHAPIRTVYGAQDIAERNNRMYAPIRLFLACGHDVVYKPHYEDGPRGHPDSRRCLQCIPLECRLDDVDGFKYGGMDVLLLYPPNATANKPQYAIGRDARMQARAAWI